MVYLKSLVQLQNVHQKFGLELYEILQDQQSNLHYKANIPSMILVSLIAALASKCSIGLAPLTAVSMPFLTVLLDKEMLVWVILGLNYIVTGIKLTGNTAAKFVRELWDKVIIDPVLQWSQNYHWASVFDWKQEWKAFNYNMNGHFILSLISSCFTLILNWYGLILNWNVLKNSFRHVFQHTYDHLEMGGWLGGDANTDKYMYK